MLFNIVNKAIKIQLFHQEVLISYLQIFLEQEYIELKQRQIIKNIS